MLPLAPKLCASPSTTDTDRSDWLADPLAGRSVGWQIRCWRDPLLADPFGSLAALRCAALRCAAQPQRDSNPCFHLERVVS